LKKYGALRWVEQLIRTPSQYHSLAALTSHRRAPLGASRSGRPGSLRGSFGAAIETCEAMADHAWV